MTDETKSSLTAFSVKFRIESSLKEETFNPEHTFGYFLKMYVELMEKKRKEFAQEISIDETLLSQLINGHRLPPKYITIRLELHSGNRIPADHWLRLVSRQESYEIVNDKKLRKKEKPFVHGLEPLKESA
jgi:plasmid maintenance system antidote protein VapI